MYRCEKRSYRDLPIRFADFGRLHRTERIRNPAGLTRVRAMSQDDAHIYCTEEQIAGEIDQNLRMVREVYDALGFGSIELKLGTMPDKHLGSEKEWRQREEELAVRCNATASASSLILAKALFTAPKSKSTCPTRLSANGRWPPSNSISTCPSDSAWSLPPAPAPRPAQ